MTINVQNVLVKKESTEYEQKKQTGMKLKSYILHFFVDPTDDIVDLMRKIRVLEHALMTSSWRSDPLYGLIELLDAVSTFEDFDELTPLIKKLESINYGQHSKLLNRLNALEKYVEKLGRKWPRNVNNTKIKEKITSDNVIIGGFDDLPLITVSEWMSHMKRNQKIDTLAKETIKNDGGQMRKIINSIL